MANHNGLLEIGSYLYELPQDYSKDGWESYFFIAKDESEMADLLAHDSKTALDMMVSEWKAQGETDEEISAYTDLFITWKPEGGENYSLYIMWGPSIEDYQ